MGRRPANVPLRVYLNNRRVGALTREASGAVGFAYHKDWCRSACKNDPIRGVIGVQN